MKILIVQRGSLSSKKFVISRSVFNRVIEPLVYVMTAINPKIILDIKSPEDIDLNTEAYDVAIFCKHNTEQTSLLSEKLKNKGTKVIYDIDDLIYSFSKDSFATHHEKQLPYLKMHMETADHVVFSNKNISEIITKDFNLKNHTVIQTGINVDKFYNTSYSLNAKKVLFTNGDNIKVEASRKNVVGAFSEFLNHNPSIGFEVFGDSEEYLKEFSRYTFLGSLPWDEHKSFLMKERYKFAIVPLGAEEESEQHQKFTVCKTAIKFFEYGALRIPAIYSKSHIYREVVESGISGLLVENSKEAWMGALSQLNKDEKLRQFISQNAFESVVENHHIRIPAAKWSTLLNEI